MQESNEKYIALLRGINLGGKRKLLMADLKALFSKIGFTNIVTYIQSGNVVFESDKKEGNIELAQKIETAILEHFKLDVPVMVRKASEWKQVVSDNPFFKNQNIGIERLHLTLLDKTPAQDLVDDLKQIEFDSEQFEIIGQHIFLCCKDKFSSKSKMTNTLFEKKLKCKSTTRNWKTVMKLSELSR
ncbi:DUF1697 domain-containing protein [Ancylomarina sp. DW003]|nr:DUF1697 domain-containing protein [Ancylomarina sp. DW003]MDE5422088.1 DUF1697 domain-containing protein [Ancylomarina sp. DW003]